MMAKQKQRTHLNIVKQVKLDRWRLKRAVREEGRVVPDYVWVNGQQEHHPEGRYYLEWYDSGKVRRCAVSYGQDLEEAVRQKLLELSQPPPAERLTVAAACERFLRFIELNRLPRTYLAYETVLARFQKSCRKVYVDEVARADMLSFITRCHECRLSGRTVYTNLNVVLQLFKMFGRTCLVQRSDWPRFVEAIRPVYEPEEIQALLKHATEEEWLMITFLLASGFRDREFQCVSWRDIDFENCVVRVTAKPALGFRPKNAEERVVPLPIPLIQRLREKKSARHATPNQLVFPNSRNHRLKDGNKIIKSIAHRAGLNCGQCVTKFGNKSAEGPHCTHFFLHKFRHTFATEHLRDGVDICSLQRWMGHGDIASTMVYLRGLTSKQAVLKVSSGWLSDYVGSCHVLPDQRLMLMTKN